MGFLDALELAPYRRRAAHNPKPADYVELTDPPNIFDLLAEASTTRTFHADWSEFQPIVTSAYPYQIGSFRFNSGYRLDNHAKANWAVTAERLPLIICYVPIIDSERDQIMASVRDVFGAQCPPHLVLRGDMETGSGFDGPGNHSPAANALSQEFAAYTGDERRVDAYANASDYRSAWPQILPWLKRSTAAYTAVDPGPYSWQFFGGLDYPVPAGFPRSCAPFGSWVDMNVINKPLAQILIDYGITPPPPRPPVPAYPNTVTSMHPFDEGQGLTSNSKHYVAVFQADGNLVVYNWVTGHADWASNTAGNGGTRLYVQGDGNMVIYKPDGKGSLVAIWSTGTAGKGSSSLTMQDDGNLVLLAGGKPTWSSKTGRL